MPSVSPVTVQLVSVVAMHVRAPGELVTVYDEIEAPPFDDGASQLTAVLPEEAPAVTAVGAPGTVGRVAETVLEAGLVCPAELVTVALKV